jgi:hypothetical protein
MAEMIVSGTLQGKQHMVLVLVPNLRPMARALPLLSADWQLLWLLFCSCLHDVLAVVLR